MPVKHSGTGTRRAGQIRRTGALLVVMGCVGLLGKTHRLAAAPPAGRGVRTPSGPEAMRYLLARKDYQKARKLGYALIWRDLDQPEAMFLLGRTLEGLNQKDEAATIYALLLLTLEDKPDPRRCRAQTKARLKGLDVAYERERAAFMAAAAGKKFHSPQAVDDGWMLAVRCDLFTPYCLGCWTLVGPRGRVPPDWIHNREGRLHRSGAKFIPDFDGRKGMLYTQSIKDKPHPEMYKSDSYHVDNLARLGGHPPQLTLTNFGACGFLRVSIKAEERPFELRVRVEGKQIFSQRIDSSKWWDLKVLLAQPPPAGDPGTREARQTVVLELVCPEDQPLSGNVWIDYADFFVN